MVGRSDKRGSAGGVQRTVSASASTMARLNGCGRGGFGHSERMAKARGFGGESGRGCEGGIAMGAWMWA